MYNTEKNDGEKKSLHCCFIIRRRRRRRGVPAAFDSGPTGGVGGEGALTRYSGTRAVAKSAAAVRVRFGRNGENAAFRAPHRVFTSRSARCRTRAAAVVRTTVCSAAVLAMVNIAAAAACYLAPRSRE